MNPAPPVNQSLHQLTGMDVELDVDDVDVDVEVD